MLNQPNESGSIPGQTRRDLPNSVQSSQQACSHSNPEIPDASALFSELTVPEARPRSVRRLCPSIHRTLELAAEFILRHPKIAFELASTITNRARNPEAMPTVIIGPTHDEYGKTCVTAEFGKLGTKHSHDALFNVIQSISFNFGGCEIVVAPFWSPAPLVLLRSNPLAALNGAAAEVSFEGHRILTAQIEIPCPLESDSLEQPSRALITTSSPHALTRLPEIYRAFVGSTLSRASLDTALLNCLPEEACNHLGGEDSLGSDEFKLVENAVSTEDGRLSCFNPLPDSISHACGDRRHLMQLPFEALFESVPGCLQAKNGIAKITDGAFQCRPHDPSAAFSLKQLLSMLTHDPLAAAKAVLQGKSGRGLAYEISLKGKIKTHLLDLGQLADRLLEPWGGNEACFRNCSFKPLAFWDLQVEGNMPFQLLAQNSRSLEIRCNRGRRMQLEIDGSSGELNINFMITTIRRSPFELEREARKILSMAAKLVSYTGLQGA